ncbi:MAG TPA: N-formylglutamate amidohydrolase [Nannocystaceae bacterium]|nr:N-formylglutamate amidohydrolase [Nannocystaceae bacterium]
MPSPRAMWPSSDAADERLDAEDLGLPPETPLPLQFRAAREWSPLVISFPHVGLAWPEGLGPTPVVDFARNADYEVDHVYTRAHELGAATVQAIYSRLLVDLNRASDDISARVVPDHPAPRPRRRPGVIATDRDHDDIDHSRPGRGVVWSSALGNVPLLHGPLAFADFRARIERFHEPYYRALETLLERRRRHFGYAILLDAHSMPNTVGIDLVVGTLGSSSCSTGIERLALDALAGISGGPELRLRLNDPYHGGEVVRRFGRPAEGIHALQLEVSRALYMDERTLALWSAQDPDAPSEPPRTSATLAHPGPLPAAPAVSKARVHAQPPSPRHAADFNELRRRVSCLIAGLAHQSRDASAVGTSFAATRATEPKAPRSRARMRTT